MSGMGDMFKSAVAHAALAASTHMMVKRCQEAGLNVLGHQQGRVTVGLGGMHVDIHFGDGPTATFMCASKRTAGDIPASLAGWMLAENCRQRSGVWAAVRRAGGLAPCIVRREALAALSARRLQEACAEVAAEVMAFDGTEAR